jgi:hypothetical protein
MLKVRLFEELSGKMRFLSIRKKVVKEQGYIGVAIYVVLSRLLPTQSAICSSSCKETAYPLQQPDNTLGRLSSNS